MMNVRHQYQIECDGRPGYSCWQISGWHHNRAALEDAYLKHGWLQDGDRWLCKDCRGVLDEQREQ